MQYIHINKMYVLVFFEGILHKCCLLLNTVIIMVLFSYGLTKRIQQQYIYSRIKQLDVLSMTENNSINTEGNRNKWLWE